jgi:AcrR family transcriptional regulator
MDEKKIEIMEKAAAVLMRYGIKSITMDELASQLGISKKTLYLYFSDKNDLVYQIIQAKTAINEMHCCMVQLNVENAIDEMLEIGKFILNSFGNINSSVFFDLQKHHPDAWKIIQDHKWKFVYQTMKDNIIRGKKEGLYIETLDGDIFARIHVSLTDSVITGESFPVTDYKFDELFFEINHFFIRGLVNEKGHNYLTSLTNKQLDA